MLFTWRNLWSFAIAQTVRRNSPLSAVVVDARREEAFASFSLPKAIKSQQRRTPALEMPAVAVAATKTMYVVAAAADAKDDNR